MPPPTSERGTGGGGGGELLPTDLGICHGSGSPLFLLRGGDKDLNEEGEEKDTGKTILGM